MKHWLAIPLVLLMLRHVDSQNNVTGTALPCGDDNLSCPSNGMCLTVDQLCDDEPNCPSGVDEGGQVFASLDCAGDFGNPREFRCTGGEIFMLDALCDGFNNCTSGEDERSIICENKCRLPYYGDCDFTRECVTTAFGQNCGDCLSGYTQDLTADDPDSAPCVPIVYLTLDAISYDAFEGDPTVEVCVEGSLHAGDLNDIAGSSFVVDLSLVPGTAVGPPGGDYDWSDPGSTSVTLTFDSTNLFTPQCFDITIIDDDLIEFVEVFNVSLSLQMGSDPRGQVMLLTSYAPVSITDNDVAIFWLDPTTYTVNEDDGTAMVYVEVTGGTFTFDIEVEFKTIEAGSTATAGADYTATTATLTFGAGTMNGTTQTVDVPILEDSLVERVEFFNIRICENASHAEIVDGDGSVTIINVNLLCDPPASIDNGGVSFTDLTIGSIASYFCNPGFEIIGDAITTCTEVPGGMPVFQPERPFCRPLCDDPPEIDHGSVTFTGNSVNDTATYTCDSGFELIGDAVTTCAQLDANSATFPSVPPPECRPLCPGPDDIANGMVMSTGNSLGDTATYTCNSGFKLIGSNTTICTRLTAYNATFSPDPPVCQPLCDDPPEIDHGTFTFTGNCVGDTATYTCDSGFMLIGDSVITCTVMDMNSAAFSPAPPECRPLCDNPPEIDHGNGTITGNSVGDTVTYTCNSGFELIGPAVIACTQETVYNATFSPDPPVCRPLCPDPPEIDHGSFDRSGANSIGDVAHYSCESGFKLVGAMNLTCTRTSPYAAEFQPEPPTCEPICPDPYEIDHGSVNFTDTCVGDSATYTCDPGFKLIGDAVVTCRQVDTYTAEFPEPPFCQPLCLDPPAIDHGNYSITGNCINDTAHYECDDGFKLIGDPYLTCTQLDLYTAIFQPEPPTCEPLCDDPPEIIHGSINITGNCIGDYAHYECDDGFKLVGDPYLTCRQVDRYSARFLPEAPVCQPFCDDPPEIDYGRVDFTGNCINDTAHYSCKRGFELDGPAYTTCMQVDPYNAEFSPEPPVCIRSDCDCDPCDENAECIELPGAGNFRCRCIPPFQGDGFSCTCPSGGGDDPHFSIVLPTGQLLCFTVQGEHNFAFNLISNEKVQMNAMFLPDSRRSEVTWMGSIGITAMNSGYKKSNATSLRFVAKENKIYIGDKVVLRARNVEKLTFTNGKLTISEAPPVEGFKYPEVLVDLHDVSLSFSIKFMNEHLDIFWRSTGVQTVNSHGLIGQFFRKGIEIDEVRKFLIMPNKEPVPVMRRPMWSFMEREMKDDQLCWTAMNPGYQGEGLIDGTYFDYLVDDVLSTEFKFKKQR